MLLLGASSKNFLVLGRKEPKVVITFPSQSFLYLTVVLACSSPKALQYYSSGGMGDLDRLQTEPFVFSWGWCSHWQMKHFDFLQPRLASIWVTQDVHEPEETWLKGGHCTFLIWTSKSNRLGYQFLSPSVIIVNVMVVVMSELWGPHEGDLEWPQGLTQ